MKGLRYARRDSGHAAKAQRIELRPVPPQPGPGLARPSRCVPRLDGYSTVGRNREQRIGNDVVHWQMEFWEMTNAGIAVREEIGLKPMGGWAHPSK